jgi:hypothetical protein
MSAKIYSFQAAKNQQKSTPKKERKKALTPSEIFDNVYSDIVDDWQEAARNNKLNELMYRKIPVSARAAPHADYVNDLNTISIVEQKLNLVVSINAPTFSGNKVGWLVVFKHEDEVYSGTSDMILESYARAFNILLYVEFISRLKKVNVENKQ